MHSILPGFRCLLAHSGPQILGFSFGSYGTTSTWWHQQVAAGLRLRNGNSPASTALLNNYFEVSEVHVSPVFQKRGIGRRLVVELLADVTAPVALLSTPEVPTESNGAFKLYRSLGFYDVLRQHLFAGDPRPFAILGANLPLQGA
ncbi:GNAT family N-acetyltransferase [Corynebacterium caspium]|nr:GNAT family N-acetyltransferase [Corynebacterium caspium]